MKEKTYPLDIQELREFEGGHLGWYSKGFWDPKEFAMALLQDYEQLVPLVSIRHETWRAVPIGRFTLVVAARPGACGAFPVTVVED